MRLSTMQQQLMTIFWREEGRPLRTTAMVISSFLCCWMPFFVWMLPFRPQPVGFFVARLAAFSNVLVSPAVYVYRTQVAQREAARVLSIIFCHRWIDTNHSHQPVCPEDVPQWVTPGVGCVAPMSANPLYPQV